MDPTGNSGDNGAMEAPAPGFSIVIPTFNSREHCVETVASALSQSRRDIEVVVDDNLSRDGTPDLLEARFGEDPRLKIVRNREDLDIPRGWNRALSHARGAYLCLLHSDNLLHPEFAETMLYALRRFDAAVAYADCVYFEETTPARLFSSAPPRTGLKADYLSPGPSAVAYVFRYQRMIPTSALVVRRDCFRARSPFDPRFRWDPDMEQMTWLAHEFGVVRVHHPLAAIRTHRGQVASWKDPAFSGQYLELLRLEHERGRTERHHFLIDWAASNEDVARRLASVGAPAPAFFGYCAKWFRAEAAVLGYFALRFLRKGKRMMEGLTAWAARKGRRLLLSPVPDPG